ncbi:MAG: DMT family transporter [Pseudomonadota bacterium]
MLAFSALVAGSYALGAEVAQDIGPAAFNAARFAVATAVLGVIVLRSGGLAAGAGAAPWRYLVLGALYAAYFTAMFEGLKTAPPVSMAAVFTLTPIMAAVFGWLLLRQITTPRIALALAIGATGALWVIFRADLGAFLAFEVGRGEAIFAAGCAAHAAYTPAVRALNRGEGLASFTFLTVAASTLILLVVGAPGLWAYDWSAAPPVLWVTLAYTAIAATAVTVFLVQFAALRLPAAKVMAYTYLVPSWVLVWQVALGQAVPPALVVAGMGLTVVALGLLLRE